MELFIPDMVEYEVEHQDDLNKEKCEIQWYMPIEDHALNLQELGSYPPLKVVAVVDVEMFVDVEK